MATVRKPSSVAARMTRMAISERLATRSFFCRSGWGAAGAAPFAGDDAGRVGGKALAIRERRFYPKADAGCESGMAAAKMDRRRPGNPACGSRTGRHGNLQVLADFPAKVVIQLAMAGH